MNTKHILPFSFPKTAQTVFVMTICEEISGISPIPKILDSRSHLLQGKPYLSPMEMGCWTSISCRHSSCISISCTFQKRISNLIKTLADCVYRHWCQTSEEKNVHFKTEWHFSHQPDCSAFLNYHEITSRIFTGKQIALNKEHA